MNLYNTHIDFMKYRKFWVWVSLALVVVGLVSIVAPFRVNLGIDFAGGTQLVLKFPAAPEVDRLRHLVESTGVRDAQIQRYGKEGENSVIVKTSTLAGSEEGSGTKVVAALNAAFNAGATGADLNQLGSESIASLLARLDPDHVAAQGDVAAQQHYAPAAVQVMQARKQYGLLTSWDQIHGLSPTVLEALKKNARLGSFAVLSVENVGPQAGAELRRKGLLAVGWALLGMLIYIGIRFQLPYGVGATMATIHDVLVTVGLYTLAGFEWNLTTIAAFLTLIGYSTNDTVVTFDRVRENLRKTKGEPLIEVLNRSINQTLSRTLLTGGTVFLAAGSLLLLGGEVLRGFAFIITVGVIIGTYSSVYVASPFALLWVNYFSKRKAAQKPAGAPKTVKPKTATPKPVEPVKPQPVSGKGGKSRAAGNRR